VVVILIKSDSSIVSLATEATALAIKMAVEGAIPAGTLTIGNTKDAGPAWISSWGVAGYPIDADVSAAATAVTDAPTSGQKLCIDDVIVSSSVAQVLSFSEESTATIVQVLRIPAGQSQQFTFRGKWKFMAANKKLMCQSNVSTASQIRIGYHSEA
jgi:hypothetical protein